MSELRFEWDETKDAGNQNKHGISFAEAKTVFADDLARLIPDPDHSTSEERFIVLGMSRNFRLLIVSHCERAPDIIRIISARKADRQERKEYEGFIDA